MTTTDNFALGYFDYGQLITIGHKPLDNSDAPTSVFSLEQDFVEGVTITKASVREAADCLKKLRQIKDPMLSPATLGLIETKKEAYKAMTQKAKSANSFLKPEPIDFNALLNDAAVINLETRNVVTFALGN